MKKRPGVMLYFDMRRALKHLSNEDKGILFDAILEYGETGLVGELPDPLQLIFPLLQIRIDSDDHRYRQTVAKKKYAAYVRWADQNAEPPLTYREWMDTKGYQALYCEDDPEL